jgi:hypothetical protein
LLALHQAAGKLEPPSGRREARAVDWRERKSGVSGGGLLARE